MSLRSFLHFARFFAFKHFVGYKVSGTPHFEPEALDYFQKRIAQTSTYLEYGMGGSTLLASRHATKIVSVESDSCFAAAVRKAFAATLSKADFHPLYTSIGLTLEWGQPVFKKITPRRTALWRHYPLAPWGILKGTPPQTILIDGRFRIACMLTSLLELPEASECLILFDDYHDRPPYHCVEQFADVVESHGRMAVFKKKSAFDAAGCRAMRDAAFSDWH